MIAQPLPSQPAPEAYAARRIAVAHRLVEMTLEVAEAAQRRALALMEREIAAAEAGEAAPAEDTAPKGRRDDPVAAVERATRSVRLSLALAARLDGDEPVRKARVRTEAAAEREAEADARRRAQEAKALAEFIETASRNEIVVDAAAQAFERAGLEDDEIDERTQEVSERLNEGEWEFDVCERPIGAVLAAVLQDQEIAAIWSLWAGEDWAIEEAATDAEGSPYARGGAAWVRAGGGPSTAPPEEPAREPVAADGSSP